MKQLSRLHRLLIHVPVGLVLALAFWVQPAYGLGFLALFVVYELEECEHIKDQAWKDVAGACWGMGLATIIWAVWRTF